LLGAKEIHQMPNSTEILAVVSQIANRYVAVAVVFHAILAAIAVAAFRGWRPSRQVTASLLTIPVVSVSVFAARGGNPFNTAVFAALTIVLALVTMRMSRDPVRRGPSWASIAGVVMLVFGLVYPHFVETSSPWSYLYAAPTGLIPCPTLSLVIGLTLLLGGLGSRAWSLTVASAGILYGVIGVFWLGVTMDALLALGAVARQTLGALPASAERRPAAMTVTQNA